MKYLHIISIDEIKDNNTDKSNLHRKWHFKAIKYW